MGRIKHWALPLAFGILGVILALSAWHLWEDHQRLHLVDAQVGVWQRGAIAEQQKAGAS